METDKSTLNTYTNGPNILDVYIFLFLSVREENVTKNCQAAEGREGWRGLSTGPGDSPCRAQEALPGSAAPCVLISSRTGDNVGDSLHFKPIV